MSRNPDPHREAPQPRRDEHGVPLCTGPGCRLWRTAGQYSRCNHPAYLRFNGPIHEDDICEPQARADAAELASFRAQLCMADGTIEQLRADLAAARARLDAAITVLAWCAACENIWCFCGDRPCDQECKDQQRILHAAGVLHPAQITGTPAADAPQDKGMK